MKGKRFNAQEVQAIIEGNKTMFREVIKPQPIQPDGFPDAYFDCYNKGNQWNWWTKDNKQLFGQIVKCPYQVGQKIFVKESFNIFAGQVTYKQSFVKAERHFWKPASQMKQEQSRLTVEITDIKVERLKEIDIKDVYKEGLPNHRIGQTFMWFEEHWNSTRKKPEEKFEANPWVWVVDFKINNLNK